MSQQAPIMSCTHSAMASWDGNTHCAPRIIYLEYLVTRKSRTEGLARDTCTRDNDPAVASGTACPAEITILSSFINEQHISNPFVFLANLLCRQGNSRVVNDNVIQMKPNRQQST